MKRPQVSHGFVIAKRSVGNPWKSHGRPMKIPRETHGDPHILRGSHGASMDKMHWQANGILMEDPWKPLGMEGPWAIHERPMEILWSWGTHGTSMGLTGVC